MRTNYKECNIEEDVGLSSQLKNNNFPCPIENSDALCKSFVANLFNDPSIIQNTADVDFSDKNLYNDHFVKVESLLAVRKHLSQKIYNNEAISHSIDESSLLGLDPDEKIKVNEQDSIILNSTLTSPNRNRNTHQIICW